MLFRSALLSNVLLLPACAHDVLFSRDLPLPIAANAESYTDCANAAWPPSNVGVELVPQPPDDELRAMVDEMSAENIEATITKLVSFGTRHTLSTFNSSTRGINAARDWIASEMRKYAAESNGTMTVEVQSYVQGVASRIPFPVTISNVLAKATGSEDPSRVYVMTGHYDSRVTDVLNYESDAPGANDDASGTAIAMELARVLAKHQPKSTIILGAVSGEEQGLYGSTYLAQTLKNTSTNVEGMLNCDIVGSSTGDRGQKDPFTIRAFAQGPPPLSAESSAKAAQRLQIGGENDSPARELARFSAEVAANNATGMKVAIIYRLDRFLRGGDHTGFLQAGYPAIRYTEPNENFAHQHQDIRTENGTVYGDLIEFVDFDFTARVGKVNLATLWSLAQAPAMPRNVTIDATILDNESRIKWIISNSTDVASYEVVWRSTIASLWTHMLDVGKVGYVVLPLSKDNVIFGIRAVGKNGYKSPAVYPFPG
ncbi:peptidase M28 [Pyrenophora tritici-repentis]|uniref:Probable zinc metalloprotease PTRG_04977 n=2 Tax=Pyrenophora tritici-repentis TaxID=45151 RepID=M28P2_PYRTR|nr:peptidase M28 [Pyrenophora tritici-repentis Pt-1C-BFP]B2W3C7.1 RecName: Full=Probable zinc metalloprotease PTRG_04977; Flags: Precursor [Pyrenophora tritici-repentis Pt-1C-BFP]KAI0582249.1 peptidase M28 [Pyrenophora tritici-repentis]EDU47884.1 peptidase M28 [Pyrenophora tritici-repentis Pt-1C-BFP]KAI0609983.1 peptidase M28 [Pyrenophora tritici-repentis]KAI0621956.1 peptidase M28 [Pyrenophora tritici-repentis]KAI1533527.1 peptidase M28 [Pyrenophora tritici-repentis]